MSSKLGKTMFHRVEMLLHHFQHASLYLLGNVESWQTKYVVVCTEKQTKSQIVRMLNKEGGQSWFAKKRKDMTGNSIMKLFKNHDFAKSSFNAAARI